MISTEPSNNPNRRFLYAGFCKMPVTRQQEEYKMLLFPAAQQVTN